MNEIFINLKRFDVPRSMGGICPDEDPDEWISRVIVESIDLGLGEIDDFILTYLIPEALIIPAVKKLKEYLEREKQNIRIGCQGVFRENVAKGKNFGAFTTNLPAAAAVNMGCSWSIIGHSEERKDKLEIIVSYDQNIDHDKDKLIKAISSVNGLINHEVISALESGINVLLCIGETETERGGGDFSKQKPRVERVLRKQLEESLSGIKKYLSERSIVIGYEPIWAIGPGKTPPGSKYIGFVSSFIKKTLRELYGTDLPVVYGGGLKRENAEMIAGIETIDGGLVALTQFTGEIGFEPSGLAEIIKTYRKGVR